MEEAGPHLKQRLAVCNERNVDAMRPLQRVAFVNVGRDLGAWRQAGQQRADDIARSFGSNERLLPKRIRIIAPNLSDQWRKARFEAVIVGVDCRVLVPEVAVSNELDRLGALMSAENVLPARIG
jgi:hypothetical protein